MVNQRENLPIIINNDRQVSNFVDYAKKSSSTTMCVTFSSTGVNDRNKEKTIEKTNKHLKSFFNSHRNKDTNVPKKHVWRCELTDMVSKYEKCSCQRVQLCLSQGRFASQWTHQPKPAKFE